MSQHDLYHYSLVDPDTIENDESCLKQNIVGQYLTF